MAIQVFAMELSLIVLWQMGGGFPHFVCLAGLANDLAVATTMARSPTLILQTA